MRRRLAKMGVGTVVTVALLVLLGALGVLPVNALVSQHREMQDASSRLALLEQRNGMLERRAKLLRTDAEVGRLAHEQFGMVQQGKKLYVIPGLRTTDPTMSDGTGSSVAVRAVPPAEVRRNPGIVRSLLQAVVFWR